MPEQVGQALCCLTQPGQIVLYQMDILRQAHSGENLWFMQWLLERQLFAPVDIKHPEFLGLFQGFPVWGVLNTRISHEDHFSSTLRPNNYYLLSHTGSLSFHIVCCIFLLSFWFLYPDLYSHLCIMLLLLFLFALHTDDRLFSLFFSTSPFSQPSLRLPQLKGTRPGTAFGNGNLVYTS